MLAIILVISHMHLLFSISKYPYSTVIFYMLETIKLRPHVATSLAGDPALTCRTEI